MDKHFVITIGCEYGSGGPDIGKIIAQDLGIEFYDRDLVDKVVEETGIKREVVEEADLKNHVRYQIETKYGVRNVNISGKVLKTQFDVIQKFAEDSSCVIIGRSSDYILKDREDVLHIFIYAPEDFKVSHIMEQVGVSEKKAKELIKYYESLLHGRHKYITGKSRGDRHTRNMLIDSSVLGIEKTAKYIEELIKLRFE